MHPEINVMVYNALIDLTEYTVYCVYCQDLLFSEQFWSIVF